MTNPMYTQMSKHELIAEINSLKSQLDIALEIIEMKNAIISKNYKPLKFNDSKRLKTALESGNTHIGCGPVGSPMTQADADRLKPIMAKIFKESPV